jgi:hypothetical protein
MRRFRGLSKGGRLLVALTVGAAVFGIATVVQASIPSANGVIHGCYQFSAPNTSKGVLRVINADAGEQCRFNEKPLNWNAKGVTGATGPTGPTGPAGPSSTITNFGAETPNISTPTNLATLTLATGTYSLSGTVYAQTQTSSPDEVRCDLTASGGTATLHAPSKGTDAGLLDAGATDTMPVLGAITVSSGPMTVHVRCAPQATTDFQATLFATVTGSVTSQ